MDQIFDKMENNEAAIAPYYAGDFITMQEENPDLAFAIPKEGTNLFVDAMCVPKGSKHKAEAEAFINFMARADISASNAEYIGYSTPSSAALELLGERSPKTPSSIRRRRPTGILKPTSTSHGYEDPLRQALDRDYPDSPALIKAPADEPAGASRLPKTYALGPGSL
jgi:spermidine/putrescine-binding protein